MNPIKAHPTWAITDSSKLQAYMKCERRFFYEYVLGWRPEGTNHDTQFGTHFHKAMEVILKRFHENGKYTMEAVNEAFNVFEELYRRDFPQVTDEIYEPKNPQYAHIALAEYSAMYARDSFEVIANEINGKSLIGQNLDGSDRYITYRIDSVIRDERGIWGLEHKTTKYLSNSWKAQWNTSVQLGTYTHGLYCNFPREEVRGMIVNVFNFKKIPKRKPAVERLTIHDYDRIFIEKTEAQMETWLHTLNKRMDQLEMDYNELVEANADESNVLQAFTMKPTACTDFNKRCPYMDFCTAWQNPLQHIHVNDLGIAEPEFGFVSHWWDPSAQGETE